MIASQVILLYKITWFNYRGIPHSAHFPLSLTVSLYKLTCDLITGASLTQPIPLSVSDCRGIVKTLVCGMKTITWGAGSCKIPGKVDFCKSDKISLEICTCTCTCICTGSSTLPFTSLTWCMIWRSLPNLAMLVDTHCKIMAIYLNFVISYEVMYFWFFSQPDSQGVSSSWDRAVCASVSLRSGGPGHLSSHNTA